MVFPKDGEGHSQVLHRSHLLPISTNLEQVEDKNSVAGVELIGKPAQVPPIYGELPADRLTEGQLESLYNLPPKQCEPANPELTG